MKNTCEFDRIQTLNKMKERQIFMEENKKEWLKSVDFYIKWSKTSLIVFSLTLILIALYSCSNDNDSIQEYCETIDSKESKLEWQHDNVYSFNYYFVLDGVKTKTTKQEYENKNVGDKICTSLNY